MTPKRVILLVVAVFGLVAWLGFRALNAPLKAVQSCPEWTSFTTDTIDLRGARLLIDSTHWIPLQSDGTVFRTLFGNHERVRDRRGSRFIPENEWFYRFDVNGIGVVEEANQVQICRVYFTTSDHQFELHAPELGITLHTNLKWEELDSAITRALHCQRISEKTYGRFRWHKSVFRQLRVKAQVDRGQWADVVLEFANGSLNAVTILRLEENQVL